MAADFCLVRGKTITVEQINCPSYLKAVSKIPTEQPSIPLSKFCFGRRARNFAFLSYKTSKINRLCISKDPNVNKSAYGIRQMEGQIYSFAAPEAPNPPLLHKTKDNKKASAKYPKLWGEVSLFSFICNADCITITICNAD